MQMVKLIRMDNHFRMIFVPKSKRFNDLKKLNSKFSPFLKLESSENQEIF